MKISTNATIGNVQQAIQDCMALAKKRELDAYLSPRFNRAEELVQLLTEAMKSVRGTVGLEEKDTMRDGRYRALLAGVRGYAALPFPEKQAAAEALLEIIERHGGNAVVNLPYREESAIIDSIQQELSSAAASASVKALDGVGELASELFAANDEVKALNLRNTEAAASDEKTAYEIKKELVSYFNAEILPYLELMRGADKAEYGAFADGIFAAVAKLNATVPKKARKQP